MRSCVNCGREGPLKALGRCGTCYWYKHRTGRDRPMELYSPRDPWCSNCRENAVYSAGRCRKCYRYYRSHGRERPRRFWVEECLGCGRPLDSDSQSRSGRCGVCYQYWLRTGKPRPRRLAKRKAPHGWCDCGEPAVGVVEVTILNRIEKMPLCREHIKEEAHDV